MKDTIQEEKKLQNLFIFLQNLLKSYNIVMVILQPFRDIRTAASIYIKGENFYEHVT